MDSKALVVLAAMTLFAVGCSAKPLVMELKTVKIDRESLYYCPIVVEPIVDPFRIPRVIQDISCNESLTEDCVTLTEEVTVFTLRGEPGTLRVNVGCVHRSEVSNPAGPRYGD